MVPFGAINCEYSADRNRVFDITADIRRLIPSCHNFVKKIAGEFYFKGIVFEAGNTARATGFAAQIYLGAATIIGGEPRSFRAGASPRFYRGGNP